MIWRKIVSRLVCAHLSQSVSLLYFLTINSFYCLQYLFGTWRMDRGFCKSNWRKQPETKFFWSEQKPSVCKHCSILLYITNFACLCKFLALLCMKILWQDAEVKVMLTYTKGNHGLLLTGCCGIIPILDIQ